MDTDKHGLIAEDQTHALIGCAMEVLNHLGHGFLEKVYENAYVEELKARKIPYQQQPRFTVLYKGTAVGDYIPDLLAFDEIVVDLKTIEKIGNGEAGQMLNYLKVTNKKIGLILNFKHAKLEWKRIVL